MAPDKAVRLYCQEIDQALELPRQRRRELLADLGRQLEEQFASQSQLTLEDLLEAVGPPEDTAGILLETVDPEEVRRYRARRRRRTLWAVLGAALVLAAASAFLLSVWIFPLGGG